jgi:hypothetical protein
MCSRSTRSGEAMSAHTNNLFLMQDLAVPARTGRLTNDDLDALRTVANWIEAFVASPHKDLGRSGPVCPFVPEAIERNTLWLTPEHLSDRSVPDVAELISRYKKVLLRAPPSEGNGVSYKAVVVVLTDVSAERAKTYMEDVQVRVLKRASYEEDGIVIGDFHARNEGPAIRNSGFRPFKSPVPFVLMRHAVLSDWMFFLDNEDWLNLWAHRFGESALRTLTEQLRRTNWRRLAS